VIVNGVKIDDDGDCYVIAEIGHNHQGNLEQCKKMFDAALDCGASAVKLQKRDNRSLFTKSMYDSPYNSENAFGNTYGAHREFLEFDKDQYRELQAYAREIGITFFSTAFDFKSADLLADLDMPAYKMASGDLTNIPLLKHVASFGKPMFMSTGGGTMDDVMRAYEAVTPINKNICIMQCTAGYPPKYEELNLRVVETFKKAMPDIVIGFSSHDNGIAMPLLAYILGARAVEKHFTLDRAMKGTDHAFSLERPGLQRLVRDLKRARIALGDGVKCSFPSEKAPLFKMGKKLVAARDLAPGQVLTAEDIAIRSPNDGLPPYEFDSLIGRKLVVALAADQAFTHADFAQ
jgi:N-acetylneuraminate synthase/sialic acid synthase